jgi:hypothetical protein
MKRESLGPAAISLVLLVLTSCSLASCSAAAPAGSGRSSTADAEGARDLALASARVWRPPGIPIGQASLDQNPPGGWLPTDEVECRFVQDTATGTTAKFDCQLPDGEIVKVKYGKANEELHSEVAAARLLTALGFGADRMFVVRRVRCSGCPRYPFLAMRCFDRTGARWPCFAGGLDYDAVREFDHVTIERRMPGRTIEAFDGQGWAWFELDRIDPRKGGSPRAELDALRLMAVLIAHWDNKPANQRLVCLPGGDRPDGTCAEPLAIIHDLGGTFGPRKLELSNWRRLPVWADARECRVSMRRMPFGGSTFGDHLISEEGRQFLLGLLEQLSAVQLESLFAASRMTEFDAPAAGSGNPSNWAAAFVEKIRQIREAGPCRSLVPSSLVPGP